MKSYKRYFSWILIVAWSASSQASDDNCESKHKGLLKSGLAKYGEIVIDYPIDEVWPVVQQYYKWTPLHSMGERKTIDGRVGEVGEVVEVIKANASAPVYVTTVRIRPLETIEGTDQRIANIVWKVYDVDACFARFSDFGVREFNGKTIFFRSMYEDEVAGSDVYVQERALQISGDDDSVAKSMSDAKTHIEDYMKTIE